jgi:serine protein kinase
MRQTVHLLANNAFPPPLGEPEIVDTSKDARLGRIFMNRTIRLYPSFSEFYGMEETIERIVGFLRHAPQGLEERKQIMYLLALRPRHI